MVRWCDRSSAVRLHAHALGELRTVGRTTLDDWIRGTAGGGPLRGRWSVIVRLEAVLRASFQCETPERSVGGARNAVRTIRSADIGDDADDDE